MCIKKIVNSFVGFFWPFLEGDPIEFNKFIKHEDVPVTSNKQDVDYAYQMYLNQKERIKVVESKSIVFIGIFGSLIAILAFVVKDLLMIENHTIWTYIAILVMSILVLYSTQVLRYSIRALERKNYESFSYDDFLNKDDKEICFGLVKKVQKNYDAINSKVENMTLAQKFMKRVLSVIVLCAIAFLFYSLWMILSLFIDSNKIFLFLRAYCCLISLLVFTLITIAFFVKINILKRKIIILKRDLKKVNDENTTTP